MAYTYTWPTESYQGKIYIPKADTTLVSAGPPEIRSLDVDVLRKNVMTAYATEAGGPSPIPFTHFGEITVSGDIFARFVVFNTPYDIEFEAGLYTVKLLAANHNIADRQVQNGVGLIIGNSFGLIRSAGVEQSAVQAGLDAQGYTTGRADNLDYLDALVSSRAAPGAAMTLTSGERLTLVAALLGGQLPSGETLADTLDLIRKVHTNRLEEFAGSPGTLILWDDNNVDEVMRWRLSDFAGNAVVATANVPAKRTKGT